jgi:hypothetical protein
MVSEDMSGSDPRTAMSAPQGRIDARPKPVESPRQFAADRTRTPLIRRFARTSPRALPSTPEGAVPAAPATSDGGARRVTLGAPTLSAPDGHGRNYSSRPNHLQKCLLERVGDPPCHPQCRPFGALWRCATNQGHRLGQRQVTDRTLSPSSDTPTLGKDGPCAGATHNDLPLYSQRSTTFQQS